MNAAARAIYQSNLFSGRFLEMRLSKELSWVLFLLMALLMSSLAVIYVTNEHRLSYSQLQQLESQDRQLQLEKGRLLLEQASLERPARIEQLAIEKLKMKLPLDKGTFILKIK